VLGRTVKKVGAVVQKMLDFQWLIGRPGAPQVIDIARELLSM